MSTTTIHATRALSDLVDYARTLANRAERVGADRSTLDSIASTLDGARTRLVEDGVEYIEAAWAFLDAGRRELAKWRGVVERNEARLSRARA